MCFTTWSRDLNIHKKCGVCSSVAGSRAPSVERQQRQTGRTGRGEIKTRCERQTPLFCSRPERTGDTPEKGGGTVQGSSPSTASVSVWSRFANEMEMTEARKTSCCRDVFTITWNWILLLMKKTKKQRWRCIWVIVGPTHCKIQEWLCIYWKIWHSHTSIIVRR